ncbi:MAG: hypothetical protein D6687_03895 [Acidobacteria bacterium]|jgi:uncharacterized protein YfeS|nr:MAG: hypothetical protein D6687_03895 [Acidobacteriota bacterium]GIU81490.1 MAG: hypothetical protein KatS3mg006_0554 [Pyrinomonadaceae bacterium]
MYRQTRFSEVLYRIREQISQEADFDAMKLARMLIHLYQNNGLTSESKQKEKIHQSNQKIDVTCEK